MLTTRDNLREVISNFVDSDRDEMRKYLSREDVKFLEREFPNLEFTELRKSTPPRFLYSIKKREN